VKGLCPGHPALHAGHQGELVLSEVEGNPLGDAIIIGMMIIISVYLFGELLKR